MPNSANQKISEIFNELKANLEKSKDHPLAKIFLEVLAPTPDPLKKPTAFWLSFRRFGEDVTTKQLEAAIQKHLGIQVSLLSLKSDQKTCADLELKVAELKRKKKESSKQEQELEALQIRIQLQTDELLVKLQPFLIIKTKQDFILAKNIQKFFLALADMSNLDLILGQLPWGLNALIKENDKAQIKAELPKLGQAYLPTLARQLTDTVTKDSTARLVSEHAYHSVAKGTILDVIANKADVDVSGDAETLKAKALEVNADIQILSNLRAAVLNQSAQLSSWKEEYIQLIQNPNPDKTTDAEKALSGPIESTYTIAAKDLSDLSLAVAVQLERQNGYAAAIRNTLDLNNDLGDPQPNNTVRDALKVIEELKDKAEAQVKYDKLNQEIERIRALWDGEIPNSARAIPGPSSTILAARAPTQSTKGLAASSLVAASIGRQSVSSSSAVQVANRTLSRTSPELQPTRQDEILRLNEEREAIVHACFSSRECPKEEREHYQAAINTLNVDTETRQATLLTKVQALKDQFACKKDLALHLRKDVTLVSDAVQKYQYECVLDKERNALARLKEEALTIKREKDTLASDIANYSSYPEYQQRNLAPLQSNLDDLSTQVQELESAYQALDQTFINRNLLVNSYKNKLEVYLKERAVTFATRDSLSNAASTLFSCFGFKAENKRREMFIRGTLIPALDKYAKDPSQDNLNNLSNLLNTDTVNSFSPRSKGQDYKKSLHSILSDIRLDLCKAEKNVSKLLDAAFRI